MVLYTNGPTLYLKKIRETQTLAESVPYYNDTKISSFFKIFKIQHM